MKKRLLGLTLMVIALVMVLCVGVSGTASLSNSITDGMELETTEANYVVPVAELFTTSTSSTFYVWDDSDDEWDALEYIKHETYGNGAYHTVNFTGYGTTALKFKAKDDGGDAELNLTLRYHPDSTDSDGDGLLEIYTYAQLVSLENTSCAIELMNDISTNFVSIESGTGNLSDITPDAYSSAILSSINATEFNGNGHTITYTGGDLNDETVSREATDSSGTEFTQYDTFDTYFISIGGNDASTIYDLTIDCGGNVNGLYITTDASLEDVVVKNLASDGISLNVFFASIEVDNCTLPTITLDIYGSSSITNTSRTTEFESTIDGVATTLPAFNTYMADSASYATLDEVIAGANAYQGDYFIVSQMESDTLTDTTTELISYLELYLCDETPEFTNTDEKYSFTVGNGGWLDISFQTVSANNDNLILVKDGGTFDTWGYSDISGVTVQAGGTMIASEYTTYSYWSDTYYYYNPTLTDITMEAGATFINDSGISQTISVQNSDGSLVSVTVAAGETYTAVETTAVAEVNGIGYTTLDEAISVAESGDTIYIVADCEVPAEITTAISANGVKLTTSTNTLTLSGTVTFRSCDLSGIATINASGADLSYNYFGEDGISENITAVTIYPYYADEDLTILVYDDEGTTSTVEDAVSDALSDALADDASDEDIAAAIEIISAVDTDYIAEDSSLLSALNELDAALIDLYDGEDGNGTLEVSTTITPIDEDDVVATAEGVSVSELITPDDDDKNCAEAEGLAVAIVGNDTIEAGDTVTVGLTINQTAASAIDEYDETSGETTTTIVVAYDITPFVSYDDGDETTVSNAEITNPITFKLYLPSIFANTNRVNLEHEGVDLGTYTVYKDSNGNPYINVTVTHFSTFEVTYLDYVSSSGSSNMGTLIDPDASTTTTTTTDDEETAGFVDVDDDDYFYDAVQWAVDNGITTGVTTTTFEPDWVCTRAQAVTFLWRAAGEPTATMENPFSDLDEDAYYYDAVLWAVDNGITLGVSNTEFAPDMDCSRAHIITFLWRFAGQPEVDLTDDFADVDQGEYYAMAVSWAVSQGITQGTSDDAFSPDKDCTRAEIVTFLFRQLGE